MDNIYILYYGDEDCKVAFYVGHTGKPKTRLAAHRAASKTGTEDKYLYIQQELAPHNIPWNMQVIKEIPDGDYLGDYERHYVIKYILAGHPIQNMKHGDLTKKQELEEQLKDETIRTVAEVKADRLKREAAVKAKDFERSEKLRRKVEGDALMQKLEEDLKAEAYARLSERQKKVEDYHRQFEIDQENIKKNKLINQLKQADIDKEKKILEDKKNVERAELRKEQERKWREENEGIKNMEDFKKALWGIK